MTPMRLEPTFPWSQSSTLPQSYFAPQQFVNAHSCILFLTDKHCSASHIHNLKGIVIEVILFVAMFLGYNQYWPVGSMIFVELCLGAHKGSTGSG